VCSTREGVRFHEASFGLTCLASNHGGRQLDGVPATIDALPECVEAARRGGIRVHVDGGIRSGNDLFKALALGAECCWVGRPAIWGLAVS
jgi:(S)-2-hydroxy-acid oxidase